MLLVRWEYFDIARWPMMLRRIKPRPIQGKRWRRQMKMFSLVLYVEVYKNQNTKKKLLGFRCRIERKRGHRQASLATNWDYCWQPEG